MKNKGFVVLALVASLAFIAGSVWADGPTKDEMVKAAEEAGVSINSDNIATASTDDGASVTAATLRGYEKVAPANLARGTDVGFVHLDAPDAGIPAGFYRLRASADPSDVKVGRFDASVDIIDGDGKVVATVPASAQASSLAVPDPLPFPRTVLETTAAGGGAQERHTIIIIIICPNGLIIIIWISW